LIFSVAGASVFYVGYLDCKKNPAQHGVLGEICLHVSIAFMVAFILTLLVEYNAKLISDREARRQQSKIASNVYSAVMDRLVPPVVARELESILKKPVVKELCIYTLSFLRPYAGLGPSYFVLRREVTFHLKNLLTHALDYPLDSYIEKEFIESKLVSDGDRHFAVPRHIKLTVKGEEIKLRDGLNLHVEKRYIHLEHSVNLAAGETVEIYLSGEEVMPLNDGKSTYVQLTPITNLEVVVHNNYEEKLSIGGIQLNHPRWESFKPSQDGIYRFSGGILPGQGFEITWHSKEKSKSHPSLETKQKKAARSNRRSRTSKPKPA